MGFAFVRDYVCASTFRGFRRVHVTTYGDQHGGVENAMGFLGDRDVIDFKGATVAISGFQYDGGAGMYVAVNGYHLGAIWDTAELFTPVYNGEFTDVFLRIERDKYDPERPKVYLFVKLAS